MKLYCVLISYAIVNSLAVNIADYIKAVAITNKLVELAAEFTHPEYIPEDSDGSDEFENGLHNIIKNLICGNASMETLAHMLVVPERANTTHIQECIDDQIALQTEIVKDTNLSVPVFENQDFPDVTDDDTEVPLNSEGEVMSYSEWSLSKLGDKRRSVTGKAILDLYFYATENNDSVYSPFCCYTLMCRLKGLIKSLENPSLYIIKAEFNNEDNNCRLTAVDKSVKSYASDWRDF